MYVVAYMVERGDRNRQDRHDLLSVLMPRPVSLYISPANVQLHVAIRPCVPYRSYLFLMLNFSAKFLHAERLLHFSL